MTENWRMPLGYPHTWANIKLDVVATGAYKIVAIDYETKPLRRTTGMSKNTLTINNSESLSPFEHVRIEGKNADAVKSFNIGERMYVLADVDAQKATVTRLRGMLSTCEERLLSETALLRAERDQSRAALRDGNAASDRNTERWRKSFDELREEHRQELNKLRHELDGAALEAQRAQRDLEMIANQTLMALAKKEPQAAMKGSPVYQVLDRVGTIERKAEGLGALVRNHDQQYPNATTQQVMPKRFDGDFAYGGNLHVLLAALDAAGKDARAAGYAINAADKIAEQIRKRL